ncbi:uncharacterized protein B0H18DRAFT_1127765 [Fomitopsis serialis]|uniref:uncharacterized protein n=1 Tax=Fomitopsis serialis TaxID=139415 RepID=UPI002008CC9B|nr:uncharacterized protein B0H18DRAFT_1127765 [Neoantrodia serialis]KAH9911989.1 hypothetical protein B0H18DRAFT_1127765 [Neoantrodia serialis]
MANHSIPNKPSTISARPYDWPHDGALSPATTALVVIDMQNDCKSLPFCSEKGYIAHLGYPVDGTRAAIPNIAKLLEAFRKHGYPVYHTREGHRRDLSTLSAREHFRSRNNASGLGIGTKAPRPAAHPGEPGTTSSRSSTPSPPSPSGSRSSSSGGDDGRVRALDDAGGDDRAYECVLVEDATGSVDEGLKRAAVDMVQIEGGIFGAVASTGDVLVGLENAQR